MAQTIQTLALNVRLSCQLLDVPESSYYERINRHPSKTQLRRQYLSLKISQLFNANRGIYGAPKIHHLLLKQGEKVGLKLVQKLMKQLQLKSVVIKKSKPGYSLSDHINRKNLIQTEPTKKNKFGQPTLLIFLLNKDGVISQPLWIVILKKSLLGIWASE
ncbi:hypothetical protein N42HA_00221 [Lactococcus lactis]|nr:hypothetical protein [Lactococcus lactis]